MADEKSANPKQNLRWYQFSLRSLLIFVTIFGVLCSFYVVLRNSAKKQKEAVEVLDKFGCELWYASQWKRCMALEFPYGPRGDDFSDSVASVSFYEKKITNPVLKAISDLKYLKILKLYHTSITDADLDYIEDLYQLEELWLGNNQITDEGLKHLEGLNHLKYLGLECTQITDDGLKHLKGLNNLKCLNLQNTQVTDAGVAELQKALPDCLIEH